jgi:YCII-related domain
MEQASQKGAPPCPSTRSRSTPPTPPTRPTPRPTNSNSISGDIITDGPFIDSKEVVAGFYVIEAEDLDAALAIARTNPVVHDGGGVEVRPVHSSYLRGL